MTFRASYPAVPEGLRDILQSSGSSAVRTVVNLFHISSFANAKLFFSLAGRCCSLHIHGAAPHFYAMPLPLIALPSSAFAALCLTLPLRRDAMPRCAVALPSISHAIQSLAAAAQCQPQQSCSFASRGRSLPLPFVAIQSRCPASYRQAEPSRCLATLSFSSARRCCAYVALPCRCEAPRGTALTCQASAAPGYAALCPCRSSLTDAIPQLSSASPCSAYATHGGRRSALPQPVSSQTKRPLPLLRHCPMPRRAP